MQYSAPILEQRFVLQTVAKYPGLGELRVSEGSDAELVSSILTEAAKLATGVFAPLNRVGDQHGAVLIDGAVALPPGFKQAYTEYVQSGWASLGADEAYGGHGLPFQLTTAVLEQFTSANAALSLCLVLNHGVIEAISAHGSESQRDTYLKKLVSGEWTGTMNLTEPQAGSDVGALTTSAERNPDGSYRIKGQKIFITYGEHDLSENIIHLVLARSRGAPDGTKGISLFIVPKYLPDALGNPGRSNDLQCVSIEHKLGIHASPTCTMSYGDNGDCVGFLLGEEQKGMRAMFTMMNHARVNIGLQGVALSERAYQGALAYARERVQSARFGAPSCRRVRIIEHADVRRMLLTMKASTEAIRALTYLNATAVDRAHNQEDVASRRAAQGLADLLTPITKAYATDVGVDMASLAIQVFGGMGYVEETGAAQHLRDARVAPIYEGTNGIQALDLVSRKLPQDDGIHWRRLFDDMQKFIRNLPQDGDLSELRRPLSAGLRWLRRATEWMVNNQDKGYVAAGATPYLRLFGMVICSFLLGCQAVEAQTRLSRSATDKDYSTGFLRAKVITARYFAEQIMAQGQGLIRPIIHGGRLLYLFDEEQL